MAGRKDYATLKKELLRTGRLFEDPDFPANASSIKKTGISPSYIQWRRPHDIVQSPRFIVKGATRFDLDQGDLGNCWFIAAAANLAVSSDKLFDRCVPKDQDFPDDYAGIFRFNFWRFGKWVEVVVDDRLPTKFGRLTYGHNREEPSEFWTALFEKAYAKLHGCYENIDGGFINDALVDFTGGTSETFDLTNKRELPSNFFEILYRTFRMNSMMGCSIPSSEIRETERPYGLYAGHAYSINNFARVTYRGRSVDLMRLRNPWGRKEWTGPWSDGSSEWKSISYSDRQKLGLEPLDDGEFWMTYDDLVTNFEKLSITHLFPDALTEEVAKDLKKRQWEAISHHSAWVRGVSAGGCGNPPYRELFWSNPQFQVTVTEANDEDKDGKCTMVVSLLQKDEDLSQDLYISFSLYKLRSGRPKLLDGQNYDKYSILLHEQADKFKNIREQARRFLLLPGTYIIIPSTFYPNKESEFLLRVFTEKKASSSGVIDIPNKPPEPKPPKDELYTIFNRFTGGETRMDAFELKHALNEMLKDDIHQEGFGIESTRSILAMMDRDKNGTLSYTEFQKMWKEIKVWRGAFKQFDRDRSGRIDMYELSKLFSELGFSISRTVLTSIVMRYGGKARRLSMEDFIHCLSKVLIMYNTWVKHSDTGIEGKGEFTLEQFLSITMYYS